MAIELTKEEQIFLSLHRGFDFLHRLGYSGVAFGVYSDQPEMKFRNHLSGLAVRVSCEAGLQVEISRKRGLYLTWRREMYRRFSLKQVYERFGSPDLSQHPDAIQVNAEFLQKHLLPILDGTCWIDKLLSRSR